MLHARRSCCSRDTANQKEAFQTALKLRQQTSTRAKETPYGVIFKVLLHGSMKHSYHSSTWLLAKYPNVHFFSLVLIISYSRLTDIVMAGCSQGAVSVQLTEDDIPGAKLSEPLEKHINHALRWWLFCRGIQVPVSLTKLKLIARLFLLVGNLSC